MLLPATSITTNEPLEAFERIQTLITRMCRQAAESGEDADGDLQEHSDLDLLREAARAAECELANVTRRTESLARAQAEAIVHSAEVIDELEETKRQLAEARQAAEEAAEATQALVESVFARTHEAILVLRGMECVSCNDNALQLFGAPRDDLIGLGAISYLAPLRHGDARQVLQDVTAHEIQLRLRGETTYRDGERPMARNLALFVSREGRGLCAGHRARYHGHESGVAA